MALDVGTLAFFLTMEDRGFTKGMDQAEAKASSLTSTAKSAANTLAGLFTGAALKTLLGSTEAVNEQMGKLNDLASRSPFAKTAFITAQQQLLSFGVEVEKTIPMLDALQNAVAATGGSSQQLQDLAFVMAQIKAAGKITGQDLLQLGQRGINAAELIGKAFGKTGAEIKEMISKNQISADEALDAITNGMAEKFAGTTDAVKQQWSGAVDRIKAAWRDMGADIASPFIDPNGGGKAVVWGNLVADTLRSVRRHVKTLTGDFTRLGSGGFDKITTGLQKVNVWVSSINTAKLVADLHRLGQYAPMITALGSAFTIMGTRSIPVIGGLTGAINPLVAAVTVLTAASLHSPKSPPPQPTSVCESSTTCRPRSRQSPVSSESSSRSSRPSQGPQSKSPGASCPSRRSHWTSREQSCSSPPRSSPRRRHSSHCGVPQRASCPR